MESEQGAATKLDVHLQGLAGADPGDCVEVNVRNPCRHCAVDRSLLVRVIYEEEALADLVMATLELLIYDCNRG